MSRFVETLSTEIGRETYQAVIDKYNEDPACGFDITVDHAK